MMVANPGEVAQKPGSVATTRSQSDVTTAWSQREDVTVSRFFRCVEPDVRNAGPVGHFRPSGATEAGILDGSWWAGDLT